MSRAPRIQLEAPINLAVTRIVVCALVLGSSELLDASDWAAWARAMRAPPAGLAWALPLLDHSSSWLGPVRAVCLGATALGLLGWRVRWTMPVAALSAGVLFALPHFSGSPRHSMHLVWFLVVLALSPSAMCLRVAWWNDPVGSMSGARWGSTLALNTLRGLLAVVYFFPGLWKLRQSGLGWIFSDNLEAQMFWKWYQFGRLPTWRIDAWPALVRGGALGVVLYELSFPWLLLNRISRAIAAAAGLAFHALAAVFLYLPFSALLGCYVVLIDWQRLWLWLQDAEVVSERVSAWDFCRLSVHESSSSGHSLRLLGVGSLLLLAGAAWQGLRGEMRAYPFACYPTFQWRVSPEMPDLWISVLHAGTERFLRDSPAWGGQRSQARWGMAWRAAGAYGEPPTLARLVGYYESLPNALRGQPAADDRVRFYRALVDVHPSAWGGQPLDRTLLGEWVPATQ